VAEVDGGSRLHGEQHAVVPGRRRQDEAHRLPASEGRIPEGRLGGSRLLREERNAFAPRLPGFVRHGATGGSRRRRNVGMERIRVRRRAAPRDGN
jgi:hypothetical protein